MNPDMDVYQPLTTDRMSDVLGLADDQCEDILFRRLQTIAAIWELGYSEVGLICRHVDAYMLWEQRTDPETNEPCESMSRWIHVCCPRSFSTVYAAMRDVEELKDIPAEHLAEVRACNIPTMKQLSTAVRNDPEVLAVAKSGKNDDLVSHVQEHHPDQHVERRKMLRLSLEESLADKWKEAVSRAMQYGAHSEKEALELIVIAAEDWWNWKEEQRHLEAEMDALAPQADVMLNEAE